MHIQYKTEQFQQHILSWWREHGRVLSWREKDADKSNTLFQSGIEVREEAFRSYFATQVFRDPYRVVVAEVMLQQTQVDQVKVKYEQWMKKWPTIEAFATSSQAEVVIEWKGLGYNRRARYLWLLGQEIVKVRGGKWPRTEKELLTLPGVGRYTARAIMSFAFGEQVGVVDVNVKRVISRIYKDTSISGTYVFNSINEKVWFELADRLLPSELADPWNQALMDFGALVCTAKRPKCEECPAAMLCDANREAVGEGFKNYAEQLAKSASTSLTTFPNKSKDIVEGKKLKFEYTDRFLRGRILDLLREKMLTNEEINDILSTKYTQFNHDRITRNIDKLKKDKMITAEALFLRLS